jgi:hypothetical protein
VSVDWFYSHQLKAELGLIAIFAENFGRIQSLDWTTGLDHWTHQKFNQSIRPRIPHLFLNGDR